MNKTLYNEKVKMLKKGTEQHSRQWKDDPRSQLNRINLVKMVILPKVIQVQERPMKISTRYFTKIETNLKFHVQIQKDPVTCFVGSIITTDFKLGISNSCNGNKKVRYHVTITLTRLKQKYYQS